MAKERINSDQTNILHTFKIKNKRKGSIWHLLFSLAFFLANQEGKILILFGILTIKLLE